MKPRDMAAQKQIEDAAAEVHSHVHGAANYAQGGDYARAHAQAERAQRAVRRFRELLGALAAGTRENPGD